MDDAAIYTAIVEAARQRRPLALATVLATRGSVPRHVGSKMVVDPEGGLVGTIGGGCGEAEVLAAVTQVIRSGAARVVRVALTDPVDSWSQAVCGGVMDVFLEPILSPDAEPRP
ncbi:MAG: XdhC family protein [Gemmatimonadetes bacterium]|nr:XdhC family protein [Gemmatimonadota bacterium]